VTEIPYLAGLSNSPTLTNFNPTFRNRHRRLYPTKTTGFLDFNEMAILPRNRTKQWKIWLFQLDNDKAVDFAELHKSWTQLFKDLK
jgi:hypothetical protein